MIENRIKLLHPQVAPMATRFLELCESAGLQVKIHETLRTMKRVMEIYGKPRFSLHLFGLALDIYPVLRVPKDAWVNAFNAWPHWDQVQCDLAVRAGFDPPAAWQLRGDRPHLQTTLGLTEAAIRSVWGDRSGNIAAVNRWIEERLAAQPPANVFRGGGNIGITQS